MHDVTPLKLSPTWTNGRLGEVGVSNKLYTCLIIYCIIDSTSIHGSWDEDSLNFNFPFKYNHSWIKDKKFCSMVRNHWNSFERLTFDDSMDRITKNVVVLKGGWFTRKR